jgi:hypothetical protein
MAILQNHINAVVVLSAKEKMRWIHARGVITGMKDRQSFWNRSKMQFPRNAMSHLLFGIAASAVYTSITALGLSASPKPTRVSFIDLGPEAFREGVAATGRDRMMLHREPPIPAATPWAATNSARALACLNYSTGGQ